MADEAPGDEKPVTFHIKTAGDKKYTVTVPLSMTVTSLKELLSSDQYAGLPAERQRLIYSGRVLKDADSLATYKIKEGNAVHMVKTAESNTRNQPAASPGGASSSSTSNQTPQLPSMAAGTGANNLLAGLTGARFAGLAQLPNQSMFGPDGGMGAPPDPEETLRRLEDPEARRQLNELLSDPAILDNMIRANPMLANMPGAREMIREMMTNPDMIRQTMRLQRAFGGGGGLGGAGAGGGFQAPGGVDAGEGSANSGAAGSQQTAQAVPNPFASMFGNPGAGAGQGGGAPGNPFAALLDPAMFGNAGGQSGSNTGEGGANREGAGTAPPNPFANPFANPLAQNMMRNMMNDPELMQRMMQSMMGSPPPQSGARNAEGGAAGAEGESNSSGQVPANPFAALLGGAPGGVGGNPFAAFGDMGGFGSPASPPDNRPPEERYADQLRQLNDMGFFDFERNVEALRRSGGSVQGAVNYLLGG